jgi:cell cycle sensor histidine kinase DivJ
MSRVADMSLGPRLMGPMLIWLVVMIAGAVVTIYLTGALNPAGLIALGLSVPALLSLLMIPVLHRTWAQIVLLAVWTGFAVMATLLGGFVPVAITFLCIPAIAMMFTRERVVEALVLAVLALAMTALARAWVDLGDTPLSEAAMTMLAMLGTAGTLALLVAAMIAGTQSRDYPAQDDARLSAWASGVEGGLLEFDVDDRLIAANKEALDQFGIESLKEDIRLPNLISDSGASVRMMEAVDWCHLNARPIVTRVFVKNGDGKSAFDMRFTQMEGGGLLLHTLDRTDDAFKLEKLRQSQTVAERESRDKTLFFAGVSHELRTPLNAIIGFSDMMRSRLFGPLPGKYAEYADLIHDSGQYMLDVIGDVLDLSKVEAGKYTLVPDTFDMTDVVRSSVKMIRPSADSREVKIEIEAPEDDPLLITADRKAARQILLNLLSNAVKFSPKGSTIKVLAREEGSGVFMSVTDTGPGMNDIEIARIGQPFAQGESAKDVEARGSGLGLSLVQTLVDLHGGRFEIESEIGEGTRAEVHLPSLSGVR